MIQLLLMVHIIISHQQEFAYKVADPISIIAQIDVYNALVHVVVAQVVQLIV